MNECSIFIQVIFALRSWWRESVSDWVSAPAGEAAPLSI